MVSGAWRIATGKVLAYAESAATAAPNAIDVPVATPTLASGQKVLVTTSAIPGFASAAGFPQYFLRYTTDGTAVTPTSPVLMSGRFGVPSVGSVAAAPALSGIIDMPAAGVLRVALNPGFNLYNEKRWLSVQTLA